MFGVLFVFAQESHEEVRRAPLQSIIMSLSNSEHSCPSPPILTLHSQLSNKVGKKDRTWVESAASIPADVCPRPPAPAQAVQVLQALD